MNDFKNNLTVIFKGLNRCNAGCVFCAIGQSGNKIIAWRDFEHMVGELEAFIGHRNIGHICFTFHGGEPTLFGAELIEKMCRRLLKLPVKMKFDMQSNFLNLTSDFKRVVAQYSIKLGTSIDPVAMDRRDAKGNDTFDAWLTNFFQFQKEFYAPGAIYVVTKNSLDKAEILYNTVEVINDLIQDRYSININPVYAQGKAVENDYLSITPEEYGQFLVDMWMLWKKNRRSISLGPIQNFFDYFNNPEKKNHHLCCSFNPDCLKGHVGIDYDLNVAGCGRRLDSHGFLGNLKENGLIELLENSQEKQQILQRSENLRNSVCKGCQYFEICHGGCPDDAWLMYQDINKPHPWCASYRMLFDAMEQERQDHNKLIDRPPVPLNDYSEKVEIRIVDNIGQIPPKLQQAAEIWLMPETDGKRFRFDSDFRVPYANTRSVRMNIWCHNHNAKALLMWEDMLRRNDVGVVLFELEGLEKALNILNAVGAFIVLDLIAIAQSDDGFTALDKGVEKFLSDPLWNSQIYPFSQMMVNTIHDLPISLQNNFGLSPINCTLNIPPDFLDNEYSSQLITRIKKDMQHNSASWMISRKGCLKCKWLRSCEGRFVTSDSNGNACDFRFQNMVAKISKAVSQLNAIHGA
jgi:uncharacterized protein